MTVRRSLTPTSPKSKANTMITNDKVIAHINNRIANASADYAITGGDGVAHDAAVDVVMGLEAVLAVVKQIDRGVFGV